MARQSAEMDADRALVWHARFEHACQALVIIADPPALMLSSCSGKATWTVPVHHVAQGAANQRGRGESWGTDLQAQASLIVEGL